MEIAKNPMLHTLQISTERGCDAHPWLYVSFVLDRPKPDAKWDFPRVYFAFQNDKFVKRFVSRKKEDGGSVIPVFMAYTHAATTNIGMADQLAKVRYGQTVGTVASAPGQMQSAAVPANAITASAVDGMRGDRRAASRLGRGGGGVHRAPDGRDR